MSEVFFHGIKGTIA